MTKNLQEKHFDVRTRDRYLAKGSIQQNDIESYYKALPNEEENFELTTFEDDEIGIGDELTEEEMEALPPMREEDIDNFDFLEDSENKAEPSNNEED